ncbi:xylosidase/arabinosidase [Sporothrix brasiliensis 5110]|uniref:Xylosidase/arabinosidase n=1 Tax=Sporothrix brasiliensis 5110 TaxID=1398154 RepID=A0A0C2F424_9PEZI|nr:xylosidase/arabinosidase [Sporothrix brasiliensis 5110]KIH93634.1 xylosidase/arabinosidase [Sporothrix brasiliensis 5110]
MAATVNPIIPGFSPDPSIVKVGEWFFLVNSTFHMFPGLPIYASQDLVSWKQIGNAIHRQSQPSLAKADTRLTPLYDGGTLTEVMASTGGLYAPTIRHHNGTFYVVCTNVIRTAAGEGRDEQPSEETENFIVSTQDIWAGIWSDPVPFQFRGIDPSLFFDDDGTVYVHGSAGPGPYTTIRQFQIDLATGAALSEERLLWRGTGGIYPEGPHMYRRNGWYYLVISEGGTHEGHMITTARSRSVWGPYAAYEHNPILTAKGTDAYIRYTGHCDLVEDDQGQWWGVCLGVRKDAGGRFIMGRESFVTRGTWSDDGWLTLERVTSHPSGLVRTASYTASSTAGNVDFLYIRDAHLANYTLAGDGSAVTLTPTPVDLAAPNASPTFVGKRQRLLDGQSRVALAAWTPETLAAWKSAGLRCGLAVFKDEHRYTRDTPSIVFELVNKAQEIARTSRHDLPPGSRTLSLRIVYTERDYRLLYATSLRPDKDEDEDEDWTSLDAVDTLQLTDPDFVGPVIGVFATSASPAKGIDVALRGLSIQ